MHFRLILVLLALPAPIRALVVGYDPITGTYGDPNSPAYVVGFNETANGVNLNGEVMVGSAYGTCTGSLLSDGESILTAAHCLDPSATASGLLNSPVYIYFNQDCGSGFYCGAYQVTSQANLFIDPEYLADDGAMCLSPGVPGGDTACAAFQGYDLAVIRLDSQAPASATRYSLYTGSSIDSGVPIEMAGVGYTGQGCIGGTYNPSDGSCPYNPAYQYGVMRQGENSYNGSCDGCSDIQMGGFDPNSTLPDQVFVAPGDSGGGSFYNGQLVGVHEFDDCDSGDCPIGGNSSFGDTFAGGVNAAWIESVETGTPEPASALLVGLGLAALLRIRSKRWRKTRSDPYR